MQSDLQKSKPQVTFSYQTRNPKKPEEVTVSDKKPVTHKMPQKPMIQQVYQKPVQQLSQKPMMQQYNFNNTQDIFSGGMSSDEGLRLLKPLSKNHKIAAIIVSICGGFSYDQLFTTVEQKSMEGTQVIVYICGNLYVPKLLSAFKNKPQDDVAKQFMAHLKQVDPDCVVINWQCCGAYNSKKFEEGKDQVFQLLKILMDRGHMAMFSDFSLKALINEWPEHCALGPNPFKQISETSNSFEVRFDNNELKECPSAQLQIIGEMAEKGFCQVQSMAGTIIYTVDQNKCKTHKYDLQVLTVVPHTDIPEKNLKCKKGNHQGAAGHVLLSFKTGGHLLTSMGHWVELMKVDTSEKKIFEIARREYGEQYAKSMKMEYQQLDAGSRKEYVSQKAVTFVQNQAPCSNMISKAAKKKG